MYLKTNNSLCVLHKNIYVNQKIKASKITTNKKVFDPVGYTNHKSLWHRGYPLEMINNRQYKNLGKKLINTDVQASFWNGDPDIDAIAKAKIQPDKMAIVIVGNKYLIKKKLKNLESNTDGMRYNFKIKEIKY